MRFLPEFVLHMIWTGEQGGHLDAVLLKLAEVYRKELQYGLTSGDIVSSKSVEDGDASARSQPLEPITGGTGMWVRFTERARRVVFLAQEEAGKLRENNVSSEHLLLGLVREKDSVAARVLDRLGVKPAAIRKELLKQVTKGKGKLGHDMQLTPEAKRAIDLAYEEARGLDNNYLGTEHLLLGLVREDEGAAAGILRKMGVDANKARDVVRAIQEENMKTPD